MTASSIPEDIPTPSRALFFALLGGVILALVVVLVVLITPKDSPGLAGTHDSFEKTIETTYGVQNVLYSSPATGTLTLTANGEEIKCEAPTDEEIDKRMPLRCADDVLIPAK